MQQVQVETAGIDVSVFFLEVLEMMAEAIQEMLGQWDHICCMIQSTNKGVKILFTDTMGGVVDEVLNIL